MVLIFSIDIEMENDFKPPHSFNLIWLLFSFNHKRLNSLSKE